MKFTAAPLKDAFIIDLEKREDNRGFFARAFCLKELESHGITLNIAQCNIGFSNRKGTLRGMHYQIAPALERKLVRCIRGAIHDVIVDMRPDSPTYLQSMSVELTADNRRMVYIPEMFAHGYQTLTDDAEILYQVSGFYTPGHEKGFNYDDAAFGLEWPLPVSEISEKDVSWPAFEAVVAGVQA